MSAVLHATDADFHTKTQPGRKVLIDFHATWCGPCRQIAPIIDTIAAENAEVTVVKVDIDQAPVTAQRFGVMSVPTLVVLNSDGTLSAQTSGPKPKTAILADLAAAS